MNGFLDRLETELIGAAQRHAAPADAGPDGLDARAKRRLLRSRQTGLRYAGLRQAGLRQARPLRVLALATPLLLALTAAALAATGVLSTGAPVRPTPHLKPRSGIGIPRPGRSRLIANSVPDPDGGPPWSMRIVRTTRGEVCLQLGRLYDGRLGVLGEDGAFHDDGRFHPLPADALARQPLECNPSRVASEREVTGMSASGRAPAAGAPARPRQERRIYFGLLGPHALSVAYRVNGRVKTLPVERGTGAYLIVLPAARRAPRNGDWGAGFGYPTEQQGRIRADPPLTRIVYATADGTCVEGYIQPVAHDPCPRKSLAADMRRANRTPRDLRVPIEVRLRPTPHRSNGGYEALVSFKAPFAVRNAESGYGLDLGVFDCAARAGMRRLRVGGHRTRAGDHRPESVSGGGVILFSRVERDVRKGAVMHLRNSDVFANDRCGRPVRIEVTYHDDLSKPGGLVVGSKVVKEP